MKTFKWEFTPINNPGENYSKILLSLLINCLFGIKILIKWMKFPILGAKLLPKINNSLGIGKFLLLNPF